MRSMNRVTLLGRLGADPVLRLTRSGRHVAQLSLATSEYFRPAGADASDSPQERTTWHRVVVWGKQAKTCAQYLKKGRSVFVDGALRAHTYEDLNKVRRLAVEVHADSVTFLGGSGGKQATEELVPLESQPLGDLPVETSADPVDPLMGEPVSAEPVAS